MDIPEAQTYTGKVVSGTGHMGERMAAGSVALEVYEAFTGLELVPGSLNIDLGQEVDMPPYSQTLTRHDHEGEAIIYITPALVNDLACFAVRNKLAEEGTGRHPKNIIEIISDHHLRDDFQLKDGDEIFIKF